MLIFSVCRNTQFSTFFSTAWLNSPLNKATRDTCDLHNHTSPEQPSKEKNLDRKFWKLERVAYLAMETDVHRDNVRWSIGNFNNPPGIWPSPVPGEGGLRVCGHAVFLYFWCGFAGIFILSCGIVVIKTKRFAVFRNFRVNSKALCGFRMLFCVVMLCSFAVFVPCLCPPPRWEEHLTIAWVEWGIWTGNVSEMEECKGIKTTF